MKRPKFLIFVLLLLSCSTATDWYVRPKPGDYGAANGEAYATAWDGLGAVVWGGAGVVAGDTLYVCGTFTNTTEAAMGILNVGADGSNGMPITIRGDYESDSGILVGASYLAAAGWTDNGDGSFYRSDTQTYNVISVEGDLDGSDVLLTPKTSQAAVAGTDGSYWLDADGDTFWYNPTGDVVKPIWWHPFGPVYLNSHNYITLLGLKVYIGHNTRAGISGFGNHCIVDGCTFKYAQNRCISGIGDDGEITNNYFYNFKCGIGYSNCDRVIIRGNYFDNGDFTTHYGIESSDPGAMQIQPGEDNIIERNWIHQANGFGIQVYKLSVVTVGSCLIQHNLIENISQATGPGSGHQGIYALGNHASDDYYNNKWSGLIIRGNIIDNISASEVSAGIMITIGRFSGEAPVPIKVFNNIVSRCSRNYRFSIGYATPGETAGGLIFQNNISLNPNVDGWHINNNGINAELCTFSNNCWYPEHSAENDKFKYATDSLTHAAWVTEIKTASAPATFEDNSFVSDPQLAGTGRNILAPITGSPVIDAGVDVGLDNDYRGGIVPFNTTPDIGAYEFGTPTYLLF